MGKWFRRILIALLAVIFVLSAGRMWQIRRGYQASREVYDQTAGEYTRPSEPSRAPGAETPFPENAGGKAQQEEPTPENEDAFPSTAPIEVDFDALSKINSDVIGWIYCEDTVINYPVVWGRDNDFYLERNFYRRVDPSGTIFADAANLKGFYDNNTILYGHHMQDMSMFATLKYWLEQDYYEAHPYMWLLTPEQDYRIDLIAGYVTAGDSATFTVYRGGGDEFREYLREALSKSEFRAPAQDEEIDAEAKYVMLSTCAYSFDLARTVLHGKLVPVESYHGEAQEPAPSDAEAAS